MSVTREFRRGDGVTVITESGIAGGRTFVLVHGIGMGHRYWSDLAEALAREGRVLALDLPGFGDAPDTEHPLSMPESGEYLAALLEGEDLHDVVLVGHSMGAQIVAETAARHPERVGAVVLIAPTVNPRERSAALQALRLLQDESMSKPKVLALSLRSYLQAGPRWYFAKLRLMIAHRVEDALPKVSAPALVIRGEDDHVSPRGWAQQVSRLLPRGRYVEVPHRGHETMVTAGEQVAKLISAHARGEAVGVDVRTPAEPPPPPLLARAFWIANDYTYALGRQLSLLAPPWSVRGERVTPHAWSTGSTVLPEIVLLPGVYEHWTFLRPLGNALNAAGYRVRVVHGLGANRRGIAETAERLARALERTPPPGAGRVLVAHSKGGLIGKQLLVSSGAAAAAAVAAAREASAGESTAGESTADPAMAAAAASGPSDAAPLGVLGLVTVCTPFSGSRYAALLVDPSIRAFLPSDETIVMLGRDTSVNGRIVSIFGRYDLHIPDGSMLEGATNVRVPVVGHFRILGAPETWRAVFDGVALLSAR
jgi:pimeloyl-ACP methyl ester carboxylesterase